MTIGLCGLVIINTTFAHFADTTTIYATLNQLFVDVIRSRCTERIVDRECCTKTGSAVAYVIDNSAFSV